MATFDPALPDINDAYQIYVTDGITYTAFLVVFCLRMYLRVRTPDTFGAADGFIAFSIVSKAVLRCSWELVTDIRPAKR